MTKNLLSAEKRALSAERRASFLRGVFQAFRELGASESEQITWLEAALEDLNMSKDAERHAELEATAASMSLPNDTPEALRVLGAIMINPECRKKYVCAATGLDPETVLKIIHWLRSSDRVYMRGQTNAGTYSAKIPPK